ncbi:MAG: OST-HTH/LOTUS domain-containing protein, partial [Gammaproteobacteria bacterium]|nr:OST-HTH/LOTUS domain-containing protein [Gammaproteobacteria bacterium]
LISNCDEFIFYDDLVRGAEKQAKAKAKHKSARPKAAKKTEEGVQEDKKQAALDLVLETVADLFGERGEEDKVWGSMVKQALKRRKPGFNETYHGFRTFGKLLEEAQERKLLELDHDEKSGGYIIRSYVHD